MRAALVLALALGLIGCERSDPHAGVGPPPSEAIVAAGDVPAGSLRGPDIEIWYAVLQGAAPTEPQLLQLREAARRPGVEVDPIAAPSGRWVVIKPSSPGDAGFDATHPPSWRGADTLPPFGGAIVIGAGGAAAEVDAIHADLIALAHDAAVAARGWILDEQSYVAFSPEAFADGPRQHPRDVTQMITVYVDAQVLTTRGLARFALPELRAHVDDTSDAIWTTAFDAAAQRLVDTGGLTTAGVLDGGAVTWSASWADDDGPRVIELTPS